MIKRPLLLLTILLVIALIIVVIYQVQTDPFSNDSVAAGQRSTMIEKFGSIYAVYQDNCLTCHGRNGEGQSGFPSLQKTRLGVDEIKELISTGRGEMPAFHHITEPQLSQLADMVKEFSD